MRSLPTPRCFMFAAAALLMSACSRDEAANNAAAEGVDSNVMFEDLGNDASALEAAGNADLTPEVTTNDSIAPTESSSGSSSSPPAPEGESDSPVLGQTKGGDTGGNTVGEATGQ